MAKNIDILTDPATGDLRPDTRRNSQGVYAEGLQVGEATAQYPTLGVGITNIANDHETAGWVREITEQLKADGMRVNEVEINLTNNKLIVDADYDTK